MSAHSIEKMRNLEDCLEFEIVTKTIDNKPDGMLSRIVTLKNISKIPSIPGILSMLVTSMKSSEILDEQSKSLTVQDQAISVVFDYNGNVTPDIKATFTFTDSATGSSVSRVVSGHPADIASSAYQYRADRKPEENMPESWFALMHFAGMPFNKPLDVEDPAIKKVLGSLLWEEIRPVKTLKLTWKGDKNRKPQPEDLVITALERNNNASTIWHNLNAVEKKLTPEVSGDGNTYVYKVNEDVNGLIISISGKNAVDYDVPMMEVLSGGTWKRMNLEIEWGFSEGAEEDDFSGQIEAYDGIVLGLQPLSQDEITKAKGPFAWQSAGKSAGRRGISLDLMYMGTSQWRKVQPFVSQAEDVDRTLVTLSTKAGNFTFLAADLENGPVYIPEYGVFIRNIAPITALAEEQASQAPFILPQTATSAAEFISGLKKQNLSTVRQKTRTREETNWESAMEGIKHREADTFPALPVAPAGFEAPMKIDIPSSRLQAQWDLEAWRLLRHCGTNPKNGKLWFNDYPYGILGAETYIILTALDMMGLHKEAEAGFEHWLTLPMNPHVEPGHWAKKELEWEFDRQQATSLPDRPVGNFSDGFGSLTLAEGQPGFGGHMDGVHAYGPGCIGWSLAEHFRLTRDSDWLTTNLERIKANVEWMIRQRHLLETLVPGGDRLWCKGLQPAHQATPDAGGEWLQWYWSEAFYYANVSRWADIINQINPAEGAKLIEEAKAYQNDIRAAVERSISLSPVVQTQDGVYHSVIPFACYMRGLGTGAWGWLRNGSGDHWGPLTFETDLSASPMVTIAGIFSVKDKRIQGYMDVLEDRLLMNNPRTGDLEWPYCGYQHQYGIQKVAEMYLMDDDISVYLRSILNGYAVHIQPYFEYVFNEHVHAGPLDKIFEDGAFVVRMRNILLFEAESDLWLAKAAPRTWFEQDKRIAVTEAPSWFGKVSYEILSDVDHGKITAIVDISALEMSGNTILRIRHPGKLPLKKVAINGSDCNSYSTENETITLNGLSGKVTVECFY